MVGPGWWNVKFTEGSLEVKLLTILTDEKKIWKGSERREEYIEERRAEDQRGERIRRKSQKKEDAGVRKSRKFAQHSVFPLI